MRIIQAFYLKKLHKLGLYTVNDLLFHFPRRYNDFRNLLPIASLKAGETASIRGKILSIKNKAIFKRHINPLLLRKRSGVNITEAIIEDTTGSIRAIWFNQPYLAKSLASGSLVSLSGKIEYYKKQTQINNPIYEKAGEGDILTHTGRLVPVYSQTQGLTSRYLRNLAKRFLPLAKEARDFMPGEIAQKYGFFSLQKSLEQIHFPDSEKTLEKARQRFAFEEIFIIQLAAIRQKISWRKKSARPFVFKKELIQGFVKNLPFKLTDDQRKTAWEILRDLEKPYPMNRLLSGDVGSGKTAVVFMAALEVASCGGQAAFMAPTEILAFQHFQSALKLFKNQSIAIGLFTGSAAKFWKTGEGIKDISRVLMLKKISTGQIDFLIGTHSLIQKKVGFKNLSLMIIDEQHRFGVRQRGFWTNPVSPVRDKSLSGANGVKPKNEPNAAIPHFLSMSATPIPRTLALAFYGGMDISTISQMPKGRKKIITKIVSPENRQKAYEFIKKQIKSGYQAFIICPMVDPVRNAISNGVEGSDASQTRSAVKEYKRLSEQEFKGFNLGLLHGRLKPRVKEQTMAEFAWGKINILVSTAVVEVGVDVPKATIMMIEGAEHFGLSALHQFRGRVGRSEAQSYCFLFNDSKNEEAASRLKELEKRSSGIELAELDLKLRGPGIFLGLGSEQSGFPDLKVADFADIKSLKSAREEAEKLLAEDLELKNYPLLRQKLEEFKDRAKGDSESGK
ncbi:ATP-dependent DNA helicase RecG [Patescibacteria group bacterium]|nr:ATP-dependent DNA helicase RecG [Patescibacteria group bacterium]